MLAMPVSSSSVRKTNPFAVPGPLAGDDHAGHAHAAALPGRAKIAGAQHAARRELVAPQRHRMAADGQPGAGVVGHQPLGLGHGLQGTRVGFRQFTIHK